VFISDEINRVKDGGMTMAAESGPGRTGGQATPKMLDLAKKIAKDKGLKLIDKDFEYIKKFIDENIKGAFKPDSNNHGDNAMEKLNGSACPKCGGDILIFDKFYKCSNSKYDKETKTSSGCDFFVFKTLAGKKLSDKTVSDLLLGRTVAQKGFTSKTGNSFDAGIRLNDAYKIEFIFN
jgi:hypothetical protein